MSYFSYSSKAMPARSLDARSDAFECMSLPRVHITVSLLSLHVVQPLESEPYSVSPMTRDSSTKIYLTSAYVASYTIT
eukprot:5060715-Amphidinium_carterae.1